MKKILTILSFAFVLALSGCVGWAHWGERDNQDRRDQPRDQHQDQHRDQDQRQDQHRN